VEEFGNQFREPLSKLSGQLGQMRERKEKLEGALRRLAATAGKRPPHLVGRKLTDARRELHKHVSEIRMVPQAGDGKPYYVAEGRWNLLGNEQDSTDSGALSLTQILIGCGGRI
jgi:hypothetical protein